MLREDEVRALYERITKKLIEKKLQISTMESATGGQIASLLTDTEGASAVLKGAFVTYSNEVKIMQGVAKETIDRYSVYSRETAISMAGACRERLHADIGLGVTGTMGNIDPANREASKPGQVYFAIVTKEKEEAWALTLPPMDSRLSYKLAVAGLLGERLLEVIESL